MFARQSGPNGRRRETKARKCLRKRKATPVGLDVRATAHRPTQRAKRPTPVADGNIEE